MKPVDGEKGFAIPLVIAVIGILALSLWGAMHVLEGLGRDLARKSDQSTFELLSASAEARLSFLLLTEPLAPPGLAIGRERYDPLRQLVDPAAGDEASSSAGTASSSGPGEILHMDGRAYVWTDPRGRGDLSISVQDDAGLFAWNNADQEQIERMIGILLDVPRQSRYLAAAFGDFIDADSLVRLNGAEAAEYRAARLAPPPNAPIETIGQLWHVLGWSEAFDPARRSKTERLSSVGFLRSAVNINTAPSEVLQAWFGLAPEEAEAVIRRRQQDSLLGPSDITAVTGVFVQAEPMRSYTFPSRRFHVTIRSRGDGRLVLERRLELTLGSSLDSVPVFSARSAVIASEPGLEGDSGNAARFPSGERLPSR